MIPVIKERLNQAIENFARKGGEILIQGGARGIDQWSAHYGLVHYLKLHSYLPFKGQASKWSIDDRMKYSDILYQSDEIIYFSETFKMQSFFTRNAAINNDCDILLAVLADDRNEGGAFWTLNQALKKSKPVLEIRVTNTGLKQVFHKPKTR